MTINLNTMELLYKKLKYSECICYYDTPILFICKYKHQKYLVLMIENLDKRNKNIVYLAFKIDRFRNRDLRHLMLKQGHWLPKN